MKTIEVNEFCSGCGVCSAVCPKHAIKMTTNRLGFYVPEIDNDICIECGLCAKKCPSLRETVSHGVVLHASYAQNEDERLKASSGGIFGVLAKRALHDNGTVYGAVFDKDFHVIIEKAGDIQGVIAMHGAKYVQSKAWESYSKVKCDLEDGRPVLFTGTPCQISGLRGYLGKEYDQLLCVEVACHGVPSDEMFHRYLDSLEKKSGNAKKDLRYFSFRYKQDSWKNYYVHAEYNSGRIYHVPFLKDRYMRSFFNDLAINPACYECRNKLHESNADITIADFWGIENYKPQLNDDKGLSLVVIHNARGEQAIMSIIDEISDIVVEEKPALAGNIFIATPALRNAKMAEFEQRYINGEDYIQLVDSVLKKPLYKKVFSRIKRMIK